MHSGNYNVNSSDSTQDWSQSAAQTRPTVRPPSPPAAWPAGQNPLSNPWQAGLPALPSGPDAASDAQSATLPAVPTWQMPPAPSPTNPSASTGSAGQGSKVARRALLVTGGLALCCGSAALVPLGIQKATEMASTDAQQALHNGEVTVLNGLRALEVDGEVVTLDAAIGAAKLARVAVQLIVLPVARINSFVTGNALGGVIAALGGARDLLSRFGQNVGWLDNLHDVLSAWRTNINQLPIALDQYSSADLDSAEKYLTALRAKVEQSANAPTKQ
jgi:hypothetical protein